MDRGNGQKEGQIEGIEADGTVAPLALRKAVPAGFFRRAIDTKKFATNLFDLGMLLGALDPHVYYTPQFLSDRETHFYRHGSDWIHHRVNYQLTCMAAPKLPNVSSVFPDPQREIYLGDVTAWFKVTTARDDIRNGNPLPLEEGVYFHAWAHENIHQHDIHGRWLSKEMRAADLYTDGNDSNPTQDIYNRSYRAVRGPSDIAGQKDATEKALIQANEQALRWHRLRVCGLFSHALILDPSAPDPLTPPKGKTAESIVQGFLGLGADDDTGNYNRFVAAIKSVAKARKELDQACIRTKDAIFLVAPELPMSDGSIYNGFASRSKTRLLTGNDLFTIVATWAWEDLASTRSINEIHTKLNGNEQDVRQAVTAICKLEKLLFGTERKQLPTDVEQLRALGKEIEEKILSRLGVGEPGNSPGLTGFSLASADLAALRQGATNLGGILRPELLRRAATTSKSLADKLDEAEHTLVYPQRALTEIIGELEAVDIKLAVYLTRNISANADANPKKEK